MGAPVWHDDLNVGIWHRAKPTVMRQHARHYAMREQDPHAQAQWDAFLEEERRRKVIMLNDLLHLADANANMLADRPLQQPLCTELSSVLAKRCRYRSSATPSVKRPK